MCQVMLPSQRFELLFGWALGRASLSLLPAPLVEQALLLDIDPGLLGLQRPLPLEVELELLLGPAPLDRLLPLPFLLLPIQGHVAGQPARGAAEQHGRRAVAEQQPARPHAGHGPGGGPEAGRPRAAAALLAAGERQRGNAREEDRDVPLARAPDAPPSSASTSLSISSSVSPPSWSLSPARNARALLAMTSSKLSLPSPLASTRRNRASSCGPSSSGVKYPSWFRSKVANPLAASRASSARLPSPSPSVSAAMKAICSSENSPAG